MKKDTKLILIVLAGILAIVLLCVFAVQGTQNKAFTLEEQVNTAQSDIRVQEKRRVDLVYNLADCVMQYDKHEAETLTAIVEGRGSSGDIENVATAITAVSEAYPELKANENYKELMNELSITENLIAEYRSNFNKQVKEYPRILNGLMGLNGEAGECIDILKKHLYQGHAFDSEHMAKELGDVAWYLAISAEAIGYDLETIFQMNIDKLRARYPDGFDADHSLHRRANDI